MRISQYIRALRLPFVSVSVLPFVFGSLIARCQMDMVNLFLGLFIVAATHLSANLINDHADSCSGVDWQDRKVYPFFGGSKLIQQRELPERFFLRQALVWAAVAFGALFVLAWRLHTLAVIGYYTLILLLAWAYSVKPLALSYRKLGELVILILYGPAVVMGGYFIQTGIFPNDRSFLLSLPFGFLTTAILFANEVADHKQDISCSKFNWVSICKPKYAYIVYLIITGFAYGYIINALILGLLSAKAWLALLGLVLALRAAYILKQEYSDKEKLIRSSLLTILMHVVVSIILIISEF